MRNEPLFKAIKCTLCTFCLVLASACSTSKKLHPIHTRNHPLLTADQDSDHYQGLASWYGKKFHHKRTANGERFNMYSFTAAHRSLPFGTRVQVRNLTSGKSVVVRINDRGPYSKSRLIDVSYSAGRALGLLKAGVARVEMSVLN